MHTTDLFYFFENTIWSYSANAFTVQNYATAGKEWDEISYPEMKGIKLPKYLRNKKGKQIKKKTPPLTWLELFLEFDTLIARQRTEDDSDYRFLVWLGLDDDGYVEFLLGN